MILRELADRLGCALRGDGAVEVDRVAPIDAAGPGSLTFVASAKWAVRLKTTQATAVIVQPSVATPLPSLLSDNPYLMFARAVLLLHPKAVLAAGVHPLAVVVIPLGRDRRGHKHTTKLQNLQEVWGCVV